MNKEFAGFITSCLHFWGDKNLCIYMASNRLASFRRNTLATHRGGLTSWDGPLDSSPSPKVPYPRTYIPLGGLAHKFVPFDILLWFSKLKSKFAFVPCGRSSRSQERSRPLALSSRRILLNLIASFMIGIVIGTFIKVDISQNLGLVKERFSDMKGDAGSSELMPETPLEDANPTDKSSDSKDYSQPKEKLGSRVATPEEILPIKNSQNEKEELARLQEIDEIASMKADVVKGNDTTIRKLVMVITTTFVQPLQAYHLNRLAQMFKAAPAPLLWIVVEWPARSIVTTKVLRASGVMYRHLFCNQNLTNPRKIEVCQKNVGLLYIKKHRLDGIVHFADEGTLYSPDLFEEMQAIRRFGAWPIALHTDIKNGTMLEGPLCKHGQVKSWLTKKSRARRFPIHFSGFAFNSTILWDPERWHRLASVRIIVHTRGKNGMQDSEFIENLIDDERQMDGLGGNCSRVMAWNFKLGTPQAWISERRPKGLTRILKI